MNGAGHAATAEGLILAAKSRDTGDHPGSGQYLYRPEERALLLAAAAVHATLADTAAVLVAAGMRPAASVGDLTAWPGAYESGGDDLGEAYALRCTHGANCPLHPDVRAPHNITGGMP